MKKLKRVIRLFGLVLLIILASCGIGITGAFLQGNRERCMNKEIRIEQVDKKEDEESEEKT